MAIKFCFSTTACPDWPLEEVLTKAGEYGYEGVELRTLGPGSANLASDPALSSHERVAQLFSSSPIEPVCLSTSLSLHHRQTSAVHKVTLQLKADMELARAIGCRFVRVFAERIGFGESSQASIQRIARQVRPLAETAAEQGVELLFENAGTFNHAKAWWWLLDLVDHPMVGMCWNVANAAAAGEPPTVSVPLLHRRIRMAKAKDAIITDGNECGWVLPGDGTVAISVFLRRLLGVGFDGFVSVEWDRLWFKSLAPPEEYLPEACSRLKAWVDENTELVEKGRKAAQKAAAKNAPKPAAALK
ncbi:MAG: hypothetical protein CMJ18_16555 [Phycisphaeraceae bacterium]|nr:hypothetical protein [Phycisphaeraceae bacterium]